MWNANYSVITNVASRSVGYFESCWGNIAMICPKSSQRIRSIFIINAILIIQQYLSVSHWRWPEWTRDFMLRCVDHFYRNVYIFVYRMCVRLRIAECMGFSNLLSFSCAFEWGYAQFGIIVKIDLFFTRGSCWMESQLDFDLQFRSIFQQPQHRGKKKHVVHETSSAS